MRIIQTNILQKNLNGGIEDFQSCMYDVDMDWNEFKKSRKHMDISISDKIHNPTMSDIGGCRTCLIYHNELNYNLINSDFHFEIIYLDTRGGYMKSIFYKVG